MPLNFSAEDILHIHALFAQDFPSAQTVDKVKIQSFYSDCLTLYKKQKNNSPFVLAACIAYKLSTEKPFGDANNKTAVQCIMAILADFDIEINAPYTALKNIIEDVEEGSLSFEGLIRELKAL